MIPTEQINRLLLDISELNVMDFQEIVFTLEDYFMEFYKNDHVFEEVR